MAVTLYIWITPYNTELAKLSHFFFVVRMMMRLKERKKKQIVLRDFVIDLL